MIALPIVGPVLYRLQVNVHGFTPGGWRTIAHFRREKLVEIGLHAGFLALALGTSTKWRVFDDLNDKPVLHNSAIRGLGAHIGPVPHTDRVCRRCGCTDSHACEGGCSWTQRFDDGSGFCNRCAGRKASWVDDVDEDEPLPVVISPKGLRTLAKRFGSKR